MRGQPGNVVSIELMAKAIKHSAGLLMFRRFKDRLEVFLVHPGGPYWAKKGIGCWTLPKGEYAEGEEPLIAAQREFHEETGFQSEGPFLELGSVVYKSGKVVLAWAFEGDCDPEALISNTCEIVWPPRSKSVMTIPEVDRGAWFSQEAGELYLRKEQRPFLAALQRKAAELSR